MIRSKPVAQIVDLNHHQCSVLVLAGLVEFNRIVADDHARPAVKFVVASAWRILAGSKRPGPLQGIFEYIHGQVSIHSFAGKVGSILGIILGIGLLGTGSC